MPDANDADLTALTVQLLTAYVANNEVPSADLAGLIQTTRAALAPGAEPAAEPDAEYKPAVTVRKSLGSRDHILSLIDGRPYRSLKRHLASRGLSPAEYRDRYKLPKDYPMVAPGYSEQRREVAKRLGLGRKPASITAAPATVDTPGDAPEPVVEASAPVTPAKATRKPRKTATFRTKAPAKADRTNAKEDQVGEVDAASPAAEMAPPPRAKRPRKAAAEVKTEALTQEPKPRRGRRPAAQAGSGAT